ncbi:MAG: hypothetical protein ACETVY_05220 [Candidatus Bathyarchaeia archaeon]
MTEEEAYTTCPTCGRLIKRSEMKKANERKQTLVEVTQEYQKIKKKWKSGEITVLEYCDRINPMLDIIMEIESQE